MSIRQNRIRRTGPNSKITHPLKGLKQPIVEYEQSVGINDLLWQQNIYTTVAFWHI